MTSVLIVKYLLLEDSSPEAVTGSRHVVACCLKGQVYPLVGIIEEMWVPAETTKNVRL